MRKLLGLAITVIALTASVGAQMNAPTPLTTFRLQAHALPTWKWLTFNLIASPPKVVIGTTVDRHTLLALIPQEGRRWELQRLTGWESGAPTTERLTFDGDESTEKQDYVRGGMTVSPDGQFLLARIFVYDLRDRVQERSVVVLLVNLRDFKVVWRRVSKDPLLANSRWRFTQEGTLVAAVGPSPMYRTAANHMGLVIPEDVLRMNPAAPGDHVAAVLSFPALEASMVCHYRVEVNVATLQAMPKPYFTDSSGVKHSTLLRDSVRPLEVVSQDESCAPLTKLTGASSVMELPGPLDPAFQFEKLLGTDCDVEDADTVGNLGLYNCRKGYKVSEKLGFYVTAESERVIAQGLERSLLVVPLKNQEHYSSTLASADEHDYLLLLRDDLKVEVYLLR
jgi:hypothetical protein